MNLLIKNANIIDAYESFYGDILIIDGIITEIGKEINKDKKQLKATNVTLSHIYPQTELRQENYCWFQTNDGTHFQASLTTNGLLLL